MKNKSIIPYLAGTAMSIIYAFSFIAAKIGLSVFDRSVMLSMRVTVAVLIMTALRAAGVLKVSYKGKAWWKLLGISLLYPTAAFLLEAKGISMTSASQAGIMISLSPVVTLVLGALVLKEKTTLVQKLMVMLSAVGVMITAAFSGDSGGGNAAGVLILVINVVCGAIQATLVRKVLVSESDNFSSVEVTYFMNITAAAVFILIAVFKNFSDLHSAFIKPLSHTEGIVAVLYLSVFCSVAATLLMNYMASKLPVARSSVFVNLSTVISIPIGVFIGNETLTPNQLIGMVLILTGVWGTNKFTAEAKAKKLIAQSEA